MAFHGLRIRIGLNNVTFTSCLQVGSHRIRGTTSADFMQMSQPDMAAAAQLAGAPEQDLASALANLRLSQQQQQQQTAMAAAANSYGSG